LAIVAPNTLITLCSSVFTYLINISFSTCLASLSTWPRVTALLAA